MSAARTARTLEWVPPALLGLLAVGFVVTARALPAASRAVPEMIGWAMLVLCGLDLASRSATPVGRVLTRWLNPAALDAGSQGGRQHTHNGPRQLVAVAGVTGFVAAIVLTGILTAVPVFVLLAARFGARGGWLRGVAASVVVTALIWVLFVLLLKLELYPGLLFGEDR